ncbi:hypothetical protein Tco_0648665 [Tanacetum coccineum]
MAKQSLTKIIGDLKPVDDDDDVGVSTIDDSTIGSEDKDKVAMAKKLSTDVGQLSKDLSKLIKSNCLSNSQQYTMIDMCDALHKDGTHLHNLVIRIEKEVKQLEQLKATVEKALIFGVHRLKGQVTGLKVVSLRVWQKQKYEVNVTVEQARESRPSTYAKSSDIYMILSSLMVP